MKKAAIVLSALLVAGCAQKPESIEPAYISPTVYTNLDCEQLTMEHVRLNAAYVEAAGQQDKARRNDIAGVILIGLPVSSLSGSNVAPQIAALKGQQQTVRQQMIARKCTNIPPDPTIKKKVKHAKTPDQY